MINKEQYNTLLPYKPIVELFNKCGEYVGGIDNIIPFYENNFNAGNKINSGCRDCIGAMLLHIYQLILEHERGM